MLFSLCCHCQPCFTLGFCTNLRPLGHLPLDWTINNVAKLLHDRRRLRAKSTIQLKDVPRPMTDLLDATDRPDQEWWPWKADHSRQKGFKTYLFWVPPPQLLEQGPKSDAFHLGGQGWSLQLRTCTSGRSLMSQLMAATEVPRWESTQINWVSWIPVSWLWVSLLKGQDIVMKKLTSQARLGALSKANVFPVVRDLSLNPEWQWTR